MDNISTVQIDATRAQKWATLLIFEFKCFYSHRHWCVTISTWPCSSPLQAFVKEWLGTCWLHNCTIATELQTSSVINFSTKTVCWELRSTGLYGWKDPVGLKCRWSSPSTARFSYFHSSDITCVQPLWSLLSVLCFIQSNYYLIFTAALQMKLNE